MFESLCGNCSHKNCCTDSAIPLVFETELHQIKKLVTHDFLTSVTINDKPVTAIKKKPASKECIFWDSKINGCSIYESRPIDCKLYPFDILLIGDSYHWIVYTCNSESNWTWSENHLKILENDPSFDELMRNVDEFSTHTDMVLPTESKKTSFQVLRKVNWK